MIAQYDEQGAEKMNRKIHYVSFGKAQERTGNEKNGAEKVLDGLQKIQQISDKYKDISYSISGYSGLSVVNNLMTDYLRCGDKVAAPEYWRQYVDNVLLRQPECDRTELTKDLLSLGEYLAKDVRDNGDDKQYKAVKRRCVNSLSPLTEVSKAVGRIQVSSQSAVERECPSHLLTIKKGGWVR